MKITLSPDQEEAIKKMIAFCKDDEKVLLLSGFAGVGKSFILKSFVKELCKRHKAFCLCAPTHKARLVIEKATDCGAVTIHKLLSMSPNISLFNLDYSNLKFRSSGSSEIPQNGFVIVDESSMITDSLYKILTEYCSIKNCKILFVGDPAQLQGVGDSSISKVFKCKNKIVLTEMHRQAKDSGLSPLLLKLRNESVDRFEPIIKENSSLFVDNKIPNFIYSYIGEVKKSIENSDIMHTKLIAYTNARVQAFNECVRKKLFNSNDQFIVGEFLTCYDSFTYNLCDFYNSMDYIIKSIKETTKLIPNFGLIKGYTLGLYDSVTDGTTEVFVLSKETPRDTLIILAKEIETLRFKALNARKGKESSIRWIDYFKTFQSFAVMEDLVFDNRVVKKKSLDYAYSSTTHKVQGCSYNNIYADMKNILSCRDDVVKRQLQYVALSRTKTNINLFL